MTDLANFFLGSSSNDVLVETYEISHPNFSQTYRFVKNVIGGVTVTLEDNSTEAFQYYPLQASRLQTTETLDSAIQINLGDQGEVMAAEIKRVRDAGAMNVKPTVIYRGYSSADYTTILEGPFSFIVEDVSRNDEGAAFEAKPPDLNTLRTGERYTLDRFVMLRGLL